MTAVLPVPLTAPKRSLTDPPRDWATFYAQWQTRAKVPAPSYTVIDDHHAVFCAMYLDLAEIKAELARSGFRPPVITVWADVLNVPADTALAITDGVLQLHARRLQTDGALRVTIDFRKSASVALTVYCAELAGAIRVVAVHQDAPPVVFTIDAPASIGGVQVGLVDGEPALVPITWAQGVPAELPDWFAQIMRTEFVFASVLYDAHPDLAIGQFAWLKSWTSYGPDLLGLFLQSSAMLALLSAELKATENGTAFVPYLSRTVYGGLAQAYVAEARKYESDFRALQTQQVVDDHFLQLAKALLADKTYQSEYATQLLAQARRNVDHAVAAADQAEQTLSQARLKAELIKADFEQIGVPDWRTRQIAKAVIEIALAVVTFGVGIGEMLAGDPAGGAAAANGAINGAKAAQKAAESGSKIAELAKQLAESMERLKKIAEALEKLVALAKTVVTVADDLDKAPEYLARLRELGPEPGGGEVTATYDWQVYQLASDAALKGPVEEGIEFADELKLAVDTVAAYGQARAAAQAAVVAAGQRYAEISLQQQLATRQQKAMQAYVDSLTKGSVPPAALLQQFYELYLGAKTGLFTAAQGYRASYYYWALRPSTINPSIVDGVDGLDTGLKALTSIALDYASALEHFDPPPQKMTDKQYVIEDRQVLVDLATAGEARWVVSGDARCFAGFDRVRLSTVRVWLDGADVPDGATVQVRMSTQGGYRDRFGGKDFQFTSKPLVREFEYRVSSRRSGTPAWRFPDGRYGYIEVDGVVDDEVSYAYFQPTPFAEWHVRVRGDRVDLSTVTRVVMEFAGSVIPQK